MISVCNVIIIPKVKHSKNCFQTRPKLEPLGGRGFWDGKCCIISYLHMSAHLELRSRNFRTSENTLITKAKLKLKNPKKQFYNVTLLMTNFLITLPYSLAF